MEWRLLRTRRLTLLADFLGRTLFDAGVVELETKTFPFRPGAGSTPNGGSADELDQPAHRSAGRTAGIARREITSRCRWARRASNTMPGTNLLANANFLFPINDAGLRDRLDVRVRDRLRL